MEDNKEVPVVPVPVVEEQPKPTDDVSLIDKRRAEIEKKVQEDNAIIPEATEAVPEEIVTQKEEPKVEEGIDPIVKIKQSVQKRIDKVVAQKKSAEEQLAEAHAEIERLKANPKSQEADTLKDDTPPTPEQVEAYILKMREEGNVQEEIKATRYLIKLEKELAIKEVQEQQSKVQQESDKIKAKQLADWTDLQKDYTSSDPKDDMNLMNQNGLLYKTALALYNDKELHTDFYDDPNVIMGFRRAVADAYREIHQQGLLKTPKGEIVVPETRTPRMSLAEPDAEATEETVTSTSSNSLSNADKVREELKARKLNRFIRPSSK